MNSEKLKSEITKRVKEAAARRRYNAGMSGSWGDNGAGQSEERLKYWLDGINFAQTGKTEVYRELVQQIKNDEDPEYHEYLRLKEKYEK